MSSVRIHRLNDEAGSANHNQNHNQNNTITMPAIATIATIATAMALAHAGRRERTGRPQATRTEGSRRPPGWPGEACSSVDLASPGLEVRRYHANFSYQAATWGKPRRVAAKVEWHPGELYPRAGFIVTNMSRPAENVMAFYNKRGTCEQWTKEGKGAIKWTRLSCRTFAANAVRLQLHALAYNLGNFM